MFSGIHKDFGISSLSQQKIFMEMVNVDNVWNDINNSAKQVTINSLGFCSNPKYICLQREVLLDKI